MSQGLRLDVYSIASGLAPGEQWRGVCPRCEGGSSGERSFSVTVNEDSTILYQCFRNKCDARGALNGDGTVVRTEERRAPIPKKVWAGEVLPIPDEVREWVNQTWHMEPPDDWGWTTDYCGRLTFPVRDVYGARRGWVLRAIDRAVTPKALTYGTGPAWHLQVDDGPVVLVEDIPSAVRLSKHVRACALLGTSVTEDAADEIYSMAQDSHVVIALDNDATLCALKLAREFSLYWTDVHVKPLQKDVKDMTEEELCQLIDGLC